MPFPYCRSALYDGILIYLISLYFKLRPLSFLSEVPVLFQGFNSISQLLYRISYENVESHRGMVDQP
jgi:hypothetical protein